jgi:hypothetical protein
MMISSKALWLSLAFAVIAAPISADELPASWQLAENRTHEGAPVTVFVETEKTPGRPAFKIETVFDVGPSAAAATLMQDMLEESDLPDGQRREILEYEGREALVYTFIDLPFILADRELAIRITHSDDPETGIHRIDWQEENAVLPDLADGVVRLTGARGYWEFRPDGDARTLATYLTQTELGGSFPVSLGDRLMKGQAVNAVKRLRGHIEARRRTHVAAGAPASDPDPSADESTPEP